MSPWLLAVRPKTLTASISPILLANAMNWGNNFSWIVALLTMTTAIFLQISVNFANDYFDFKSGVDTEDRLGPVRATQSGLITPSSMFIAMLLTLLIAFICSFYLLYLGGTPIILLFIFSVICVVWYSGGPFPLASLGLGEVTVFLFFGWAAVLGTEFLHQNSISLLGLWLGTQIGFISASIMLVNNIRDIATDTPAGKKTLAVRLGKARSEKLYTFLLVIPFVMQAVYFLYSGNSFGAVLPFLTAPLMIRLIKNLPSCKGDSYNDHLASTAKFLLIFSVALSVAQII